MGVKGEGQCHTQAAWMMPCGARGEGEKVCARVTHSYAGSGQWRGVKCEPRPRQQAGLSQLDHQAGCQKREGEAEAWQGGGREEERGPYQRSMGWHTGPVSEYSIALEREDGVGRLVILFSMDNPHQETGKNAVKRQNGSHSKIDGQDKGHIGLTSLSTTNEIWSSTANFGKLLLHCLLGFTNNLDSGFIDP